MEGKDRENKPKQRLKGLFSKEKKATTTAEVNEFLYGGSTDKLDFPAPLPPIARQPQPIRLDTTAASRWPSAVEVQDARAPRGRSPSPKRSRKGLVVQFTDRAPEIIGFGGDFAESPTITLRNRAQTLPGGSEQGKARSRGSPPPGRATRSASVLDESDGFRPRPIQRTATGTTTASQAWMASQFDAPQVPVPDIPAEPRNPNSFAARVQREMRADEGRALMQASNSPADELFLEDESPSSTTADIQKNLGELELNTVVNANVPPPPPPPGPPGPPGLPTQLTAGHSPTQASITAINRSQSVARPNTVVRSQANSPASSYSQDPRLKSPTTNVNHDNPPMLSRSPTVSQGVVGEDALQNFISRVTHLFTLFRLSTESVKPVSQCSPEEVIRASMWWFLKGRSNLEATVRDRPSSPEAQQANFLARQQAYGDLAKAWWIIDTLMPQVSNQGMNNSRMFDIQDAQQSVHSGLRKLAMSMTRNQFLPPEEAPLPQGLDNAIFLPEDGAHSFLLSLKPYLTASVSDALPLGDTSQNFHYGRLFADAILMEEGEAQQYRFPVLLSLVRNRKEKEPAAIITNQSGTLSLCIQGENNQGPRWDDIIWHVKSSTIDIRRLRGSVLRLHCSPQDFRTLFGIFEYQRATYLSLKPRQEEIVFFQATLKTFQYFGQDPNSSFPKEPLPQCQLNVFEKVLVDKSGAVRRAMHRGFRLSLVTSPTVKILRGINQDLTTIRPLQLGFLRGEDGLPALLVKIDEGQLKYTMVFTFENVDQRSLLYAKLTGTMLGNTDSVVAETKVRMFSVAGTGSEDPKDSKCLKELNWQGVKVINEEEEEDSQNPSTVITRKLRVIMDFRVGNIIDRVNMDSGELKLRLGVSTTTELKIFRQQQQDMTISVSESQVSKEMPLEFAELLATVARSQSVRTYTFPRLEDLHMFQAALTGYTVVFDGLVASFNISRRRMVVPIYKKWDAATTRVQLVKRDKAVQLVAFFENFAHGDCMNFALKSTDVFETFGRSGKFSLRIVDAKFPLPKSTGEGEAAVENGFVCIGQVEYPGEHDDITIIFDGESDRERFSQFLPAPVKTASRMASVRR